MAKMHFPNSSMTSYAILTIVNMYKSKLNKEGQITQIV